MRELEQFRPILHRKQTKQKNNSEIETHGSKRYEAESAKSRKRIEEEKGFGSFKEEEFGG